MSRFGSSFDSRSPSRVITPLPGEVSATVETPAGKMLRVPAFWLEGPRFAVRVFGSEAGQYHLRSVEEYQGSAWVAHPLEDVEEKRDPVLMPAGRSFVSIDPQHPQHFAFDDGRRFVPVGGNIPWLLSPEDSLEKRLIPYYQKRFEQFANAGLNWARIWMAHWSRLNLDWLEEDLVDQPEPGWLVQDVAENWDRIIASAESTGVYIQMVLQHHGQYSTETNPKWAFNPWNGAFPNGFLEKPADFFTSERARQLSKQKYRYIIARWGYSPAVLAWELFNEVHWVDAIRYDFNEAAVANWHSEMADYIRSIDMHNHLITTSTEQIASPIYARMDFVQPHMYPMNMLDNMRHIDPVYDSLSKPVFFGEYGDDHLNLSEEQKQNASAVVPPVWAGLMGTLPLPPQPWFMDDLIEAGRLGRAKSRDPIYGRNPSCRTNRSGEFFSCYEKYLQHPAGVNSRFCLDESAPSGGRSDDRRAFTCELGPGARCPHRRYAGKSQRICRGSYRSGSFSKVRYPHSLAPTAGRRRRGYNGSGMDR